MQGRIVIDFGPQGVNISSAMAGGNGHAQPVPDAVVKALLLQAWEIMLTQCIAAGLKNEPRVSLVDKSALDGLRDLGQP